MAKKKVTAIVKLQCPAGKATPAPPVGPALGPHGVSAPQFCQQFNERTKGMEPGLIIPAIITVYGGQELHVHPQDAAGLGPHQEGARDSRRVPACRNKQKVGKLPERQA